METHHRYYELERHEKDLALVNNTIYGLAEAKRAEISNAKKLNQEKGVLIANPGCYPTASSLALLPLFNLNLKLKSEYKEEIFDLKNIIIDAKSGASGAGRKAATASLFTEVNESFRPYNLAHKHRHNPEIEEFFSNFSDEKINLLFSPHLVPMSSGILSTCYASLNHEAYEKNYGTASDKKSINSFLKKLYEDFYNNSPMVQVLEEGRYPNTAWVKGTNKTQIHVEFDKESSRIIAVAAIDNTVKGASGQAIQNMNLLYNLKENLGLNQKVRVV